MADSRNAVIGFPRWTDKITFATGGTAAPGYSVSNLGALPLAQVWRSSSTNAADTSFVGTLDKARSVRLLGLVGHNLSLAAQRRLRLYSGQAPLDLDFSTGKVDQRLTFSRSSAASYTDVSGVLRTAASGVPRIDYDTVTHACRGLLVEESQTNLITRSEEFDHSDWSKYRSGVSINAAPAPNGTTTADLIIEDATASNTHGAGFRFSATSGTTYAFSVFVRMVDRNVTLALESGAGLNHYVTFNLTTGAVADSFGSPAATITQASGGWYRVSIAATATSTAMANAVVYLAIGTTVGSRIYNGNGSGSLQVWGGQLEAGAAPSSYTPTTGSPASRSADVASVAASMWLSASGGSVLVSMTAPAGLPVGPGRVLWQADDGSSSNRIRLYRDSGGILRADVTVAGTRTADLPLGSVADGSTFRIAFAWADGDFAASLSGGAVVTASSGALPSGLTVARLGSNVAGASQWGGAINRVVLYPKRLTNAALQAISASGYDIDAGDPLAVYNSGWVDAWPTVYPYGTLEWEDDRWWSGKYAQEDIAGYRWTLPIWLDKAYLARSFRVDLSDPNNASGYVECGLCEVAQGWQVSINPDYGAQYGFRFRTQSVESIGGAKYFERREKPRVFKGQIQYAPQDEAKAYGFEHQRQMDLDVVFLWMIDPGDQTNILRDSFMARSTDPGLLTYAAYGRNTIPLAMEEAL